MSPVLGCVGCAMNGEEWEACSVWADPAIESRKHRSKIPHALVRLLQRGSMNSLWRGCSALELVKNPFQFIAFCEFLQHIRV